MISWNRTRSVWRIGVIGMMALVGYACTDDERNPVETTAVTPTAAALAGGETDGYDLNFDNAPTPESSQTVNITSSPLAGIGGVTTLGEWEFPSPYKVGTGLINPFMRVQANGMEEGFNTDNGTPLDTKSGTRSLPLNYVPVLVDPESPSTTVRQFIFDANENNNQAGDWRISIDQFDVYVCGAGGDQIADRSGLSACVQVYNIDGSGQNIGPLGTPFAVNHVFSAGSGFATDALTSGSGKTLDYDILIQNASFDAALEQLAGPDAAAIAAAEAACQYNGVDATPCGYWVVVDVIMGDYNGGQADTGGFNWTTDATFEEFSTIIQPWVEVSKTATPSYTRTYSWTIEKDVDDPTHYLFAGQSASSEYTVSVTADGSEDSGWSVTGAVTIVNPSDQDVMIESITDVLTPGDIPVALDCGGTAPYMLASGGTLECTYTKDDFTQQQIDAAADGFVNNVQVQLDGLAAYFAVAPFNFDGDPTSEVNKVVNVTDLFDAALTQLGSANWDDGTTTFDSYSREFTCGDDAGEHLNTATIEETGQTSEETVTVYCRNITVEKDASTALERTYLWNIDKSVSPDTWALFDGDSGVSDYTVTVTPNGVTDAMYAVSGTITITNPAGTDAFDAGDVTITDIVDVVPNADGDVTISCMKGEAAFAAPGTIGAGETVTCDYSTDVTEGTDGTNTATVSAHPGDAAYAKDFVATADITFGDATVTDVNRTVRIDDTFYMPEPLGSATHDDGVATFDYSRTFSCGADEGQIDNTATIFETGQNDGASVTVTCYDLAVEKDADTEYTRTYEWDIEKSADPATHTLFAGQSGDTEYTVNVTQTGYTDSNFSANGTITVTNNHPTMVAMLTGVSDMVGATGATVDCPAMTVPAGGTLECTYSTALADATGATNTATATQQNYDYASDGTPTAGGTTDYQGQAAVEFGEPTDVVNATIDIEDYFDGEIDPSRTWSAGETTEFTYSRTFTCGEEYGSTQYDNTAVIVQTQQSDDASVTRNCLNVMVEKDAATSLTRTYNWDIDKSASPASWDLFEGDAGSSQYTVEVGLDETTPYTDSDWIVSGGITVTNPNALPVFIQSVTDVITGGVNGVVTCEGVNFPYELEAGGTLDCTYTASTTDDTDRTNTATVAAKPTAEGTSKDFEGTADVSFADPTLTEVNRTVDVVDSWPADDSPLGQVDAILDGSKTFNYERVFACGNVAGADDSGAGTYGNTAEIVQTGDSDDADVTVACYELDVTKDASTTWTRSWDWDINKDVDATRLMGYDAATNTATVGQDQLLTVYWDVDLSAASTDYGYAVAGTITVSNAGNPIAATINSVSDLIAGSISASVDCGVEFPHTIAAEGSLECTYSSNLDDASTLQNTATATQQNYAYAWDLSASMAGTTDYSGMASIEFSGIPSNEIDECVTLSDILDKAGVDIDSAQLGDGDWCVSDGLSTSFEVSFDFGGDTGIALECDENMFNNTASFVTNDTETTGSDDAPVNIFVDCIEGCTLTQGYWKTHSMYHNNGKQYDDRWENIGELGENTIFFQSGQSWIDVFWTAPKGNVYYNLAHQYMAAKLNVLADANDSAVADAITAAEAWFSTEGNTPAYADTLRGQDAAQLRDWASIFADFNEGLIGPGHCTEEQMDEIRDR